MWVGCPGWVVWCGCLAGSGERWECPYSGEGFDERVCPGVRPREPQLEPACMVDDPGGDVEEREAESFPAAPFERQRQTEVTDPAGSVVRKRASVPPQPVPEEVLHWRVDQPEVFFELTDGVLWDPAAKPMVGFDHVGGCEHTGKVRHDCVEPPTVEVIERQLVASGGALTAHNHP